MIHRFKKILIAATLVLLASSFVGVTIAPATTYAAPDCNRPFLTFPTWYRGLTTVNSTGDGCDIVSPATLNDAGKNNGLQKFIWTIVLNILDILLQVVAYITVVMIIYGGYMLLANGGSPDSVSKGKTMIRNAITGLIIALLAIAIVNRLVEII